MFRHPPRSTLTDPLFPSTTLVRSRPVTIEFLFAPNGYQQELWPSFYEAEAARQQLLLRAPDAQLRIALAGADIGDVDWPVREKLRFADGSYAPTPWHEEPRSEEHTSELQSLMRISYAVFCLKKKTPSTRRNTGTRRGRTPHRHGSKRVRYVT